MYIQCTKFPGGIDFKLIHLIFKYFFPIKMNRIFKTLILVLLLSSTVFHQSQAEEDSWVWWGIKQAAKGAVAVGVGAGAIAAAPVVLTAAGFTGAGIAAGSMAAGLQATMGGVVASGGALATLQSAGAAGIGLATKATLGAVGAAVGYKAAETVEEKVKSK
ncbi:interferon alpha-inducible protein 27-like protein 2 [Folsomia candida]|uniref:Interferon alpha-inducible protein 27, mitochondrial n=1 Tax=Folsomia candida TaxID=158441 RepID=A0A226DXT3_FOLCA|nr:interferon alpha-inducible protein 27-like protein 2 [Folsomia candida]OXA50083.1 Interferon alpha-inducible protein 27, mitochondrial [Folsomia candida]